MQEKLVLYGFNNLTKTLSYNIYDVCYAKTREERQAYVSYIDNQYNSDRLTNILMEVSSGINAKVLNISRQDYEPQGASVNFLIANEELRLNDYEDEILAHLDKSHITVHTFPEYHPDQTISTFRVDIEVATCGTISPLNTLDFLISSFDSDIMTIDYRVRGFTRDEAGKKYFIDHEIGSIQDYISEETLALYEATDVNVEQSNIFHTKMMIKELDLENYVFGQKVSDLSEEEQKSIMKQLQREMWEIYSGSNLYGE
jgi:S-adenosylmethionine decarboxylase